MLSTSQGVLTSARPVTLRRVSCTIPDHNGSQVDVLPPLPSSRQHTGATTLAELTTIGVGGSVATYVEASTEAEFVDAIREADDTGVPLLILGGGSNILPSDDSFPGIVVRDTRSGIELLQEGGCEGAHIRVLAGTAWDELVVHAIEHEWMGLEFLSGIPGSVGAAPVQNIGAYGQEVAAVIARVRTWDRLRGEFHTFTLSELDFGYRHSLLKTTMSEGSPSPRYAVVSVDFQLRHASLSAPVRYSQLAALLDVEAGERVPMSQVRAAVVELRRSKGMVLDDTNRDTFSCGSFFTNPVLSQEEAEGLPESAPRFGVSDESRAVLGAAAPSKEGRIKTSAAWLIDHAGFPAGFALKGSRAALSSAHCLALTNRGGASGRELRELARHIQTGVEERYGVHLEPEPVILDGL